MSDLGVLQVNHADVGGGAAVAGYRLHDQLRHAGVRSEMLVGSKGSTDDAVTALRPWLTVRRPIRAAAERMGLNELDGISAYRMGGHPGYGRADVVHYHAIHGGYFSYPAMAALTRDKPSVLTLHDMWPLTGHCSFSFGCERWRSGCGSCPHPEAFPAVRRDATRIEWRLKETVWSRSRLTVVSPSAWLADVARSSMLGRFDVQVIPHGIDTDVFAPTERVAARHALRLPTSGTVLLFAATSVSDRRKGADLVLAALRRLSTAERSGMTVALMGAHGPQMAQAVREAGCEVVEFGFVTGDRIKALIYGAADLFVFPTRADNSPLVVLESLACATPVVSFDVGGVSELVEHGRSGLLAAPEDVDGLAAGIQALIADPERRARMGDRARTRTLADFDAPLAAARHIALYRELLQHHRQAA
jgi:glycosyltransferase involved in cell wall biosynthesis